MRGLADSLQVEVGLTCWSVKSQEFTESFVRVMQWLCLTSRGCNISVAACKIVCFFQCDRSANNFHNPVWKFRCIWRILTYSMVQSPSWEANWFAASQEFPAFYGTRRFITALTSVRQLSLSCASPIQSTYPHPTSWRSILILSTHLRLGLPSGL